MKIYFICFCFNLRTASARLDADTIITLYKVVEKNLHCIT